MTRERIGFVGLGAIGAPMAQRIAQELGTYHASYPLRIGMPSEALRSRLNLDSKS